MRRLLAFCIFLTAGVAQAGDWHPLDAVAPGEEQLRSTLDELERRVADAEAVHDALGMLQNALAAAEYDPLDCRDPLVASLVARSRVFGAAHRDKAQGVRVQVERLKAVQQSETVRHLRETTLGERSVILRERGEMQIRRQREAASWQWHYLEQRKGIERCGKEVSPAPGLPSPVPGLDGDRPIAIWADGRLCPGTDRVRGVVLVRGPVCLDDGCRCTPAPVAPGAAL